MRVLLVILVNEVDEEPKTLEDKVDCRGDQIMLIPYQPFCVEATRTGSPSFP